MLKTGDESNALHLFARWVSDLANPLFIPPFVFILVGSLQNLSSQEYYWLISLSILFYTFIPLGAAVILLRTGKIESLDIVQREARNLLYILGIISASLGSFILGLYFIYHRPFLTLISGVFFLNPLLGYILNKKWKVSIHSGSVASGGIILFYYYLWETVQPAPAVLFFSLGMLLILLPLIMWSRFKLRVHTLSELLGGVSAGIVCTTLEILIIFYALNL
ncbi:MAG: hypothetical protein U5K69_01010 [Balneolaceae bacterium]|nr:hypothetical protein [Balneolaceae bacterium]